MDILPLLRDPVDGGPLTADSAGRLSSQSAERSYEVHDGIPILPASAESVFDEFIAEPAAPEGGARAWARQLLPSLVYSGRSPVNYRRLASLLGQLSDDRRPRVLVVGGSVDGAGFEELRRDSRLDIVSTDVSWGPQTQVICDVHQLPFASGSFDAVVAQAVLEHVVDPARAVSEMHRVLGAGGLVYSEIPFLQPVHEGAHDFTRYTLGGHRRLLREFTEIDAGATSGPASAFAWSSRSLLLALAGKSRLARIVLGGIATVLLSPLKYLDAFLVDRGSGIDSACGTYFLGRRAEEPRSDSDIIAAYEGSGAGFKAVR